MTKYESRVGKIQSSDEKVFNFLSNFNNFKQFIPEDQVKDWQSDENTCSFTIGGLGGVGLEIIEKNPNEHIKITGNGMASVEFFMWIQLKQIEKNISAVKVTMKAELNPMMQMMAAKPLKNFLNMMIDYMEKFNFDTEQKEENQT